MPAARLPRIRTSMEDAASAGETEMFRFLGQTLALLRMLRGKKQTQVAREAGIGKSQLSKYESGRELPRLETLEKLLRILGVGPLELACTLALVRNRADRLEGKATGLDERTWLLVGHGLVARPAEDLFSRVVTDLLTIHQSMFEQLILGVTRGTSCR